MGRWVIIWLTFFPLIGWGQSKQTFHATLLSYLATDNHTNISLEKLDGFLERLKNKRVFLEDDVQFLGYLFTKTHEKFLRYYQTYATFGDLVEKGDYNCLTGTALYAALLDHFRYNYEIIETNYHIFISIKLKDEQILFETTDPLAGFIRAPNQVKEQIALYKENRSSKSEEEAYQFECKLFNRVSLGELTGLLYYNLAVDAFNQQNLSASISYLEMAIKHYHSERIREFTKILLTALNQAEQHPSVQKECIARISSLLN